MSAQTHRSDPRVLNRRTLAEHHRRLADFLRPGISVLDVGCGTGAITIGIAQIVGANGRVVGVDRDVELLEIARRQHASTKNVVFEIADALALPFTKRFDVVTASRAVQWISRPEVAIAQMAKAAKKDGHVVVLDYNHECNSWDPDPPDEFRRFYGAFLAWREANGWRNDVADQLPAMFASAELQDIQVFNDDEIAERDAPDFSESALIWAHVAESLGPSIVGAGYLTEQQRASAEERYREFVATVLQRQTLCLRTVAGSA